MKKHSNLSSSEKDFKDYSISKCGSLQIPDACYWGGGGLAICTVCCRLMLRAESSVLLSEAVKVLLPIILATWFVKRRFLHPILYSLFSYYKLSPIGSGPNLSMIDA